MANQIAVIQKILNKNGIDVTSPIKTFEAGQVNFVYQIGEEYVLKIEKDLDVTAHQPEVIGLALAAGAKVPKVLDVGNVDGAAYLLMEKLPGRKLAEDWLMFSESQKEEMMRQVVDQMKIFHSVKFDEYALPRPVAFSDWQKAVDAYTVFEVPAKVQMDDETSSHFSMLKDFYQRHHSVLHQSSEPVLVHNDLHFESILHADGKLTGILDFDFARQAPKEYELRQMLDFFSTPVYLVEEKWEEPWRNFEVENEIRQLRKYYPELFVEDGLIVRLKLYIAESLMGDLIAGATQKFNHRFKRYFDYGWLENHLSV